VRFWAKDDCREKISRSSEPFLEVHGIADIRLLDLVPVGNIPLTFPSLDGEVEYFRCYPGIRNDRLAKLPIGIQDDAPAFA
jgi:hypothetical protein